MITGTGLVIAGARCIASPAVGISLLGAGAGCYLIGGGFYIVGSIMNPAADSRFWRNIPCQMYVVPLKLSAGKHQIMVKGYTNFDLTGTTLFNVVVPENKGLHIVHLPMMQQNADVKQLRRHNNGKEYESIVGTANGNRLMREIK
jgi:hypothetical protein